MCPDEMPLTFIRGTQILWGASTSENIECRSCPNEPVIPSTDVEHNFRGTNTVGNLDKLLKENSLMANGQVLPYT